jgi:hypothetical protein
MIPRCHSERSGRIPVRGGKVVASSIEIIVQPVYIKDDYVYIPARFTSFFPPGEPKTVKPIKIETGYGVFDAQLQYNSKSYI